MRNLPKREQLEKWSQKWEQIKQFLVLESQIERAKEIMGEKAALPSDVQSIKHEDHAGLAEDEQKRIEAVANEKGSDSKNQACAQPGESVLEKQGLFHQEEYAHCEQKTAEADVEKLETGHAAMSLVVQHELGALKSEFNQVLDAIGLVPPWVDTQRESGQFLTDDKVLVPQTFRLLDFLLLMKADDYKLFEKEGHIYGCVSPLSDVLLSHRTSTDDVKKSTYQNALEEYIEVLTERLLVKRERLMAELAINELTSEKEGAATKIKDAIKDQFGEMVYGKSIAAKMTKKVKALVDQLCRDHFFLPALSTSLPSDRLKIEESVSKCIAAYHQEKRAERYLNDYYTLAFRQADTMTDKEVSGLFQRIIAIDKKAHMFVSVASIPMIRRMYSMSCSGDYQERMLDELIMDTYESRHETVILQLIEAGVGVDSQVYTKYDFAPAMMIACKRGNNAIVSQLIEAGVDINAKDRCGKTALTIARENGHEAVVKQLTEAIKVHDLMEACKKGYGNIDSQLITGVDINTRNQALMMACSYGHEAAVTQLIEAGADVNVRDKKYGWTALIEAIRTNHEAVVDSLIALGANVNAIDEKGRTALMWACQFGHEAIVDKLIALEASVNARDDRGWTALMWACFHGRETTVPKLIKADADVHARNNHGDTALMYARGNTRITTMLENARTSADDTAGSAFSP